jgi:S-DNA-T family DNA segregation ATPase FtsK/SpoIIIE
MIQPRLRPPTQRELDVLGLGLVAFGVFLGFVLYGHGNGGRVGQGLGDALAWVLGEIRYLAPVALVLAGGLAVMRPVFPSLRPFWAGGLCLFAGLTLVLAANAFGVAPAGVRHGFWHAAFFQDRGGILGEALYWASSRLASDLGADVLAVFLLAAGLPLITGASIGGALRATGHGVADTTRVLRRSGHRLGDLGREAADWWAERSVIHAGSAGGAGELAEAAALRPGPGLDRLPPEPADSEPVVRATHVEAPPPIEQPGATHDSGAEPKAERFKTDDPDEPAATGVTRAGAAPSPDQLTPRGRYRASVTDDPEFEWRLPDPGLLRRSTREQARPDTAGQERVAAALIGALADHKIEATVVGTVAGPHITRYELRLKPGIKLSRVANLKDDLAYALAATEIRILAPIPGKQAVGVEVPNDHRRLVQLGDVFQEPPEGWSPLSVWLGKDVSGRAIGADLTQMPHLLLAGTTGSGKSATINAMLASVLLRASPHEVRVVLVDPKQVELNHYEGIPHLLTPVITSARMAANALANLVREMEARYALMSTVRMRSLPALNRVRAGRGEAELPYVMCVIDELADLMMVAPTDVEDSIIRLAQKARAVGIHLVLATQSPRVDVITGMIKANVPSRIAFAVSSQTDSRVILDHNGAESLLGQGDMLFSPVGSPKWQRIQGAYVDEVQIAKITASRSSRRSCSRRCPAQRTRRPRAASSPTRTRCWRRRSGWWWRWGPRRPRCSSAGCGWGTPGRGG